MAALSFPPRLSRGRAILAIVRRDYLVRRSYRLAIGMDLVFGVMNLLLFYFISRTFEDAATAPLGGAPDYFAFAVVGMAVTLVVQAAITGLAVRVREEQLTGTLETLVAQPLTATEMSLGLCGVSFVFAMLRTAFYLLVAGLLLGLDLAGADWSGFAIVLLATWPAMVSLGILSGAVVMVVKRGQGVMGMFVFGMGLLSGAFFPVTVLPDWLEPVGAVVPTRFAYDGIRGALYQGSGWLADALMLVLFGAVFLPLAILAFAAAFKAAKRSGSLSQY
ncbi:MAG: transporter permease [Solirubrobacterales bacterium]|jgi:ABC-type multidrug transport system permease subunit|nr:transporter permease [Solirubrobacterales bacterium]